MFNHILVIYFNIPLKLWLIGYSKNLHRHTFIKLSLLFVINTLPLLLPHTHHSAHKTWGRDYPVRGLKVEMDCSRLKVEIDRSKLKVNTSWSELGPETDHCRLKVETGLLDHMLRLLNLGCRLRLLSLGKKLRWVVLNWRSRRVV